MSDLQTSPRPRLLIVLLVATSLLGFSLTLLLPGDMRKLAAVAAVCLILSALWLVSDFQSRWREHFRQRFLKDACPPCGYDLGRSAPETTRCSECGCTRWTPEQPIEWPLKLWPKMPSSAALVARESDMIIWMLERRPSTPAQAWGSDEQRRKVASAVLYGCRNSLPDEPWGRWLPHDPFSIVSACVPVAYFIHVVNARLGVSPSPELCATFEAMTLGQVVDEVIRLVQQDPRDHGKITRV